MTGRTLRVLLLDDRIGDAEILTWELGRSDRQTVTQRVDSAESFSRALHEFAPDVVLSDHTVVQFDVFAALEALRTHRPTVPLIVVSAAVDAETAVKCLRAGAEDLLLKESLERLPSAIAAALRIREPLARLTSRQVKVLCLVAEGLTTRQIARRLKLSMKTVETHRGEVMKRLDIHGVVGLVRYAVRLGLVPGLLSDR